MSSVHEEGLFLKDDNVVRVVEEWGGGGVSQDLHENGCGVD